MSWNKQHKASRAASDRKEEYARAHAAEVKEGHKAKWEQSSSRLVAKSELSRRMDKAKQQEDKKLLVRRQRLAALLQAEHEALTQEIKDSIETDDQRRERMIRDAMRVKKDRENRRKAEVAAIQEEQFRESLDTFRTRKSRAIRLECAQERIGQLEIQREAQKKEEMEAKLIHNEYMKIADRMLAREVREKEIAKAKNSEVVDMIAEQLILKKRFQEQEEAEKSRSIKEWKQRLHEQDIAEQQKEAAKMARRIKMDAEVAEQNRSRLGRAAKLDADEKALDMQLLQLALKKEEEDKQREAAAKNAAAEENKGFQAFLKQQMQKEQADNSALAAILKQENDHAWEKREAKWNRESAAREKLNQEVEKSRQVQLAVRTERTKAEVDAKKAEIIRLRALYEQGIRDDQLKNQKKSIELSKYRQQLTRQVQMREDVAKAKFEEEVKEKIALKNQYEAFDKKVEEVFQSDYKPPTNYRRKKVNWYS